MAASWTPPASGTPCWINVLATDPARAKAFYESVFHWKFREHRTSADGTQHFEAPGQPCPSGGITRVDPSEFISAKGKGGVVLYLAVDDLKAYAEKIVDAGGKQVSDVVPEGQHAIMQNFEDTEGNFFGIYEFKG